MSADSSQLSKYETKVSTTEVDFLDAEKSYHPDLFTLDLIVPEALGLRTIHQYIGNYVQLSYNIHMKLSQWAKRQG